MNALWEEYIFRILQKTQTDEMEVSFQNSDKFWEKTNSSRYSFKNQRRYFRHRHQMENH